MHVGVFLDSIYTIVCPVAWDIKIIIHVLAKLLPLHRTYRKIPNISPGAYIFQRPFLRGLFTEGNLRFKIDWASLIVGSKFTIFALFYFVFEGNFPSTSPWGAYIMEGQLSGGFFALPIRGAYTWRGLFS